MHKMTITEANQNFSRVAKAASSEGGVVIEKNGREELVVLPMDAYRRLSGDIFWLEDKDGGFKKVESTSLYTMIYEVFPCGHKKYTYNRFRFPRSVIDIRYAEDLVELDINEVVLKSLGDRDVSMMAKTSVVDVSESRVSTLTGKKNEEALDEVIELSGLLEEYENAVRNSPDIVHQLVD